MRPRRRIGLSGWAMIVDLFASICVIDGSKQRCVPQRLRENGDDTSGFGTLPHSGFAMGRNHDGRNLDAAALQILVQFQTSHLRHLQVDDQTFRQSVGERGDELLG